MVTSRTFDRAKSFADRVAGRPIPFENAIAMLPEIDLIFVSTTAPYYLLTYDRIQVAMRNRSEGMMILDLSNPRTVEESVAAIKKVKLINMDQIAEIVEKNIRSRKNEIQSAEKIIDIEMKSVDSILKRKKVSYLLLLITFTNSGLRVRTI
jgi:glutamyl-tRNA reductase